MLGCRALELASRVNYTAMTATRKTTKHSHESARKKTSRQRRKRLLIFLGVSATTLLAGSICSISLLHNDHVHAQVLPVSHDSTMESIGDILTQHQTSTLVTNQNMINALRPVLAFIYLTQQAR